MLKLKLETLSLPLLLLLSVGPIGPLEAAKQVFKVAIMEVEGFSMLSPHGAWFGLVPELVEEIGKRLDFEANFTRTSDGRFGSYEESTGKWTGLIGEVVANNVAFAAAPLTVTALREQHVDFSQEFLDTGLVALIKKPEWINPIARSAAFFLNVFDAGVWCAVMVVFVLTSFFLFVNDRYNPRELKARQVEHSSRSATVGHSLLMQMNDFSLFGSLFYVVSTGCFQGYRRSPQSLVGRSLSIFWWLFACIFAAAYVATFLCALVASRGGLERQFPLLELHAGASQADSTASLRGFTPVWLPNGSTDAFFRQSTEPAFQMIYSQYRSAIKENPRLLRISSIEELIEAVKSDGSYFAVVESTLADFYSRATGCQVVAAGSFINDRSYAFAFPEGSELTRRVNEVLLDLRESGFIRASYRKFFLHEAVQCNRVVPPAETVTMSLAGEEMARMFRSSLPLTLRSFSGPILFYFVSLLVSATAVLGDVYIFTRYERYRQGNQPFQSMPEHHQEPEEPPFGALTFSDDQRLAASSRTQQAEEAS